MWQIERTDSNKVWKSSRITANSILWWVQWRWRFHSCLVHQTGVPNPSQGIPNQWIERAIFFTGCLIDLRPLLALTVVANDGLPSDRQKLLGFQQLQLHGLDDEGRLHREAKRLNPEPDCATLDFETNSELLTKNQIKLNLLKNTENKA